MPRHFGSLCLALVAICLLSELDIQTSSAQIFRRFQNRRQNRATPTQPSTNRQRVSPTPQVTPTPAATQPTQSGFQRSNPPATSRRPASPGKLDLSKYGPSILIRPNQSDRPGSADASVGIRQVGATETIGADKGDQGQAKGAVVPAVAEQPLAEKPNSDKRVAKKPVIDGPASSSPQTAVQQNVRPSMGIEVLETNSGVQGVSVTGFRADSKADDGGLKKGDVIVAIDNQPTPNIPAVAAILDRSKVGQTVQARVLRGQSIQVVKIPLLGPAVTPPAASTKSPATSGQTIPTDRSSNPSSPQSSRIDNPFAEPTNTAASPTAVPRPRGEVPTADGESASATANRQAPIPLGVSVRPLEGARGVTIAEVTPNSPASAAGLKVGDRIVSVDGRLTAGVDAFKQEIQSRRQGATMSLGLVRGTKMLRTTATLSPPTPTSPVANATSKPGGEKDGSLLGGIGSVLGGIFGGSQSGQAKSGKAPVGKTPSSGKPVPKTEPEPKTNQGASLSDEMALGDDKAVKPVGFESEIANKLKKLVGDPPSLQKLGVPSSQKSPVEPSVPPGVSTPEPSAEQLRDQIRKLQEQLEKVETADQ